MREAGEDPNWPTPETHQLWLDYVSGYSRYEAREWEETDLQAAVTWEGDAIVKEGMAVRLETSEDGSTKVLAPDSTSLGILDMSLSPRRCGLALATIEDNGVAISYLGPDSLEAAV